MQTIVKRVVVIDDDSDFAESLAMVLEFNDYYVEHVNSGEEALSVIQERDFDVCFLDIKLPRQDGVFVAEEIRKCCPEVKIIMMTGFDVYKYRDKCRQAGALELLRKPLDLEHVLKIVQNV